MYLAPVLAKVGSNATADTTTMWQKFGNNIVQIFAGFRPFVIALVVVALVVDGVGCIIGGEQSRERFKHALPWIVGAAAMIMFAYSIANAAVNGISNGSDIQTVMPMISMVM